MPIGVFDSTLEEIKEHFGRFRSTERRVTDRRVKLYAGLQTYLAELKAAGIAHVVYVDGSFISAKVDPSDIDVTFSTTDSFLLRLEEWTPSESNLVHAPFTRRAFGIDAWPEYSAEGLERRVQSWLRMKPPGKGTKGLLRVTL